MHALDILLTDAMVDQDSPNGGSEEEESPSLTCWERGAAGFDDTQTDHTPTALRF